MTLTKIFFNATQLLMATRRKPLAYAAVSIAVSCALGGCSFLFTTAPPEHVTPYTTLDCTTGNAAPVIDSVIAALDGVGTVVEVNRGYSGAYIAAGVGWTIFEAAAAFYGYSVTSDCRAARDKLDQMIEQQERRRWAYPPPPYRQPYP